METTSKPRMIALLATALTAAVLLFQNCGGHGMKSSTAQSEGADKLYGNGGGYSGKTTIYARKSENMTCPDGTSVESTIELTSEGQAFLTRKNCQAVRPLEVPASSLNLMAHNIANIVYENGLYDEASKSNGTTAILCRGDAVDPLSNNKRVVDALIRKAGTAAAPEYFGHVIVGVYAPDGTLIKTYDMGEIQVRPPVMMAQAEVYSSISVGLDQRFMLRVRYDDLRGVLQYNGNVALPGEPPTDPSERFVVEGLHCYRQ